MEIETESRFTLFYGNRTAESTMFATELDRARITLLRPSRDPATCRSQRSRNHAAELQWPNRRRDKLKAWMADRTCAPDSVDEWFMCGPVELDDRWPATRSMENGVDAEHIHLELFFGYAKSRGATSDSYQAAARDRPPVRAAGDRLRTSSPATRSSKRALQRRQRRPLRVHGRRLRHLPSASRLAGPSRWTRTSRSARADLDAGYVLTCQSHPTSPAVSVDYDA